MKKAFALAVLAGASAAASAQSSVTLFGIVDGSVRYTKNAGDTGFSANSGGANTSRIGFRGVEDLGGGLKAGFWLESGINVDSGTSSDSSKFWNRRSTVSLLGSFGEIRLGRDFAPTYVAYSTYDVFGTSGIASADKFPAPSSTDPLGTNAATLIRTDNQVSYFLPSNIGGLYGQVSVAAGEGNSDTGGNGKRYIGGRIGYAAGPFDVSGAYGETRVSTPFGGDDKFKVGTVGASYDFNYFKLMAFGTQQRYDDAKLTTAGIGATVPLGAGLIRASFIDVNGSGDAINQTTGVNVDYKHADARQYAIGYMYNLSKRTALYGTVAYIDNKDDAKYTVNGTPSVSDMYGEKSRGVEMGIRHSF